MRQLKYKYGDILTNIQTHKRTIIKKPILEESYIRRNGRLARQETFTGEYYCFWHDENGETVYGNVLEELLVKSSSTSSNDL